MGDQRFDSAKAFAERAELHSLQESLCPIQTAEIERDHPAEARHLFFCEIVSSVVCQTRIVNPMDVLPAGEVFCDCHPIRIVAFHSNGKRLDTTQHEP